MAGQLPEGETAERLSGVAARVGERQACLRPRGLSAHVCYAGVIATPVAGSDIEHVFP